MTGQELYNKVFDSQFTRLFDFYPYEIEDLEGVTCYDENYAWRNGWYNHIGVTFRYEGKKYYIERKEHSSDNVSETEWLIDTFHEVVSSNEFEKDVDKIIKNIEDETVGSWEELIQQLEAIKTNYGRMIEC